MITFQKRKNKQTEIDFLNNRKRTFPPTKFQNYICHNSFVKNNVNIYIYKD
jgi:hypothetical protein